jgi:hypothetical protein
MGLLQAFPAPSSLPEVADQLGMLAGALTTVEPVSVALQPWED